jgi:hypothetical protein
MMDARGLKISLDMAESYSSRSPATASSAPAIAAATAAAAAAAATATANATGPGTTTLPARAPPSIDFTFFNEQNPSTPGPGEPTRKRARDPEDGEYGPDGADGDDAACGHSHDHAEARLDPLLRAAGAVEDSERAMLRKQADAIRSQLAAVEEALARLDGRR